MRQFTFAALSIFTVSMSQANTLQYVSTHYQLSNQIQSQTYLDNYTDDYGNGPLHGAALATTWTLADNPGARYLFDFQSAYYDKINTTVLSGGIIQRFMLNKQPQTWYAGLDFTKYDDMNFYQFVMANDTQIYGFGSKSRMYLPFGNSQTYAGDFTSTITGMRGMQQTFSKQFDKLQFSTQLSYYRNSDVKDDIFALSAGLDYEFNQSLRLAASYQFNHGLDTEDTGYTLSVAVPLYQASNHAVMILHGLSNEPMQRQLGALLQAEEANCAAGTESYSLHGATLCASANPFKGSALLKNGIRLDNGIHNDSFVTIKDLIITSNSAPHFITRPTIVEGEISIGANNLILFSENAFLLSKSGHKISIGSETSKDRFTTFARANDFHASIEQEGLSQRKIIRGHKKLLNLVGASGSSVADSTTYSDSSTRTPYFIVSLADAPIDVQAAVSATSSSDFRFLNTRASLSASSGSDKRDSTITLSPNAISGLSAGGSVTDKFAKIKRTQFVKGGLFTLGTNLEMANVTIDDPSDTALRAVGGTSEIKQSVFRTGPQSNGLLHGAYGAKLTSANNLFDTSNGGASGVFAVKLSESSNVTTAANKISFNSHADVFTMAASGNAVKDALQIASLNNVQHGGLSLALDNTLIYAPAITGTIGDATKQFANIGNSAVLKTAIDSSAGAARGTAQLGIAGLTIVTKATSALDITDLNEALGLGKLAVARTDADDYGEDSNGNAAASVIADYNTSATTSPWYQPTTGTYITDTAVQKPALGSIDNNANTLTEWTANKLAVFANSTATVPASSSTTKFQRHKTTGLPTAITERTIPVSTSARPCVFEATETFSSAYDPTTRKGLFLSESMANRVTGKHAMIHKKDILLGVLMLMTKDPKQTLLYYQQVT